MPIQVSYPGVYIDEQLSGSRTITAVSTSTASFVGMARRGRLDTPTRVTSRTEYERLFGSDATMGELTPQVLQFFLNGGNIAWITRIADGAHAAAVTLGNEAAQAVLTLTARDAGEDGNLLRAEVDYATASPETTFNLTVYRRVVGPTGAVTRDGLERFAELSMDPSAGRYVETIVKSGSALITANADEAAIAALVGTAEGVSISGLVFPVANADAFTAVALRFGNNPAATRSLRIAVDGQPAIPVSFAQGINLTQFLDGLRDAINQRLTTSGLSGAVTVTLRSQPQSVTGGRLIEIRSVGGAVAVSAAPQNDVAAALQLGPANGGIEISRWSRARPAPTGLVARPHGTPDDLVRLRNLASAQQNDFAAWQLTDPAAAVTHGQPITFGAPGGRMFAGTTFTPAATDTVVGSLLNVRQNLGILAAAVASQTNNRWATQLHGLRLALTPLFEGSDAGADSRLTSSDGAGGGYNIGASDQIFAPPAAPGAPSAYNVRAYTVGQTGGVGGLGPFQSGSVAGINGAFPQLADYQRAFEAIDREVDIFNIMVLPRALGQSDAVRHQAWGPASGFCQQRRAFLIVDPPSDNLEWEDVNEVTNAGTGIGPFRIGITLDFAAIYWPRVRVVVDRVETMIDPAGTMAGLYARTDANRGVWKAPAGVEASLRGVLGVEHRITDTQNGLINPEAVNAIRIFPDGVVAWGARTMVGFDNSGNDDFKYVPVRRLTLLIEESLYRGLRFAVFEPNAEPLWAQIRLAAGAFMNNLFRQGAFKGEKASDAYFVKCDAETTTQNDINLGIVNVVVGFAALKPAEFIIVRVQQIAGQVEV